MRAKIDRWLLFAADEYRSSAALHSTHARECDKTYLFNNAFIASNPLQRRSAARLRASMAASIDSGEATHKNQEPRRVGRWCADAQKQAETCCASVPARCTLQHKHNNQLTSKVLSARCKPMKFQFQNGIASTGHKLRPCLASMPK